MLHVLQLWFGIHKPVDRKSYAISGFGLMLLKYVVEVLVIWLFTSTWFMPWDFLNPLLTLRTQILQPAPAWVPWLLFVWSLPFLWIAISMSIRRCADAGRSPWLGLLVLVPLLNIPVMLSLCGDPSNPQGGWVPDSPTYSEDAQARSAAFAVASSLMVGAGMMVVSVYWLETYGAALFFGTPLVMGMVAGYLFNRHHSRTYAASMGLGLAVVCAGAMALLLFALEGVICIAMAVPLLLPLGLLGGLMGKAIADSSTKTEPNALFAIVLLPLGALAESRFYPPVEYKITTVVEVDAPPEVVWRHVISFPELSPATELHFRLGIASPQAATIDGQGVGAVRRCEFTTGTFVEPITAWEPGRRLAFDVAEQPVPMFELTPYQHVHPPHLDGYLRSNRGEFLLTVLPNNRTRLAGSTWYELQLYPQTYWTMWSNGLIHSIHNRVLNHVKQLAEADRATQQDP